MANIIIYSTPSCVYCKMAKKFFDEKDIEYTEKNVAGDQEAMKEAVEKSGQMGVPVIDIDGKIMVGFDKEKIKEVLEI
ncbi:MAG: glutaredoxin family protein [Candidatus Paceibacterota bacterium]